MLAVSLAGIVWPWTGKTGRIVREARKAEAAGEVTGAYLLYAKAAAADPGNKSYWGKSVALRRKASIAAQLTPPAAAAVAADEEAGEADAGDIREAREALPPPELKPNNERRDFQVRADAKVLFEQIARAYGLDCVFDGDYTPGSPVLFALEGADAREALRAAQSITGSFIVALSDKLFLVAKDTQQKRNDLEPNISLSVEIPQAVTVQEAQELARSVQQTMEIRRFGIDSVRRVAVMNDKISKVLPAEALYRQMLGYRSEVAIEVKFIEVSKRMTRRLGLNLPKVFEVITYDRAEIPDSISKFVGRMVTFGGGASSIGIGIANAAIIAEMESSRSKTLFEAMIRASDGVASQIHVGDRYPILTSGYYGGEAQNDPNAYRPPPSFNFEDLGLTVKVTPKTSGSGDVGVTVEAEFKVLAGSALNGIPVISNRKFTSQARVKTGEWAVLAGLMSVSEARSIAGLAGLSSVPVLGALVRSETKEDAEQSVLILIRPRVLGTPPEDRVTQTIWVGPESRLNALY